MCCGTVGRKALFVLCVCEHRCGWPGDCLQDQDVSKRAAQRGYVCCTHIFSPAFQKATLNRQLFLLFSVFASCDCAWLCDQETTLAPGFPGSCSGALHQHGGL